MKRILVIADDFTGAAELAGVGFRFGIPTRILRSPIKHSHVGLTVLDTDSRALSPSEASACVSEFLEELDPTDYDLIYKKTDSVLRGPVLVEILSILRTLFISTCVLLPHNPSRKRVISNGQYTIDGVPLDQTAFAHDPDYPRTTSDAAALLAGDSPVQVTLAPVGSSVELPGIYIAEAENDAQVWQWAQQVKSETLPAGGADFFTAMLKLLTGEAPRSIGAKVKPERSLFICGSASAATREFVARHQDASHCIAMPDAVFDDSPEREKSLQAWADQLIAAIQNNATAIAYVGQEVNRSAGVSSRIETALAQLARTIISRQMVTHVFVEGGATASAVCKEMNWHEFEVESELASGVVALSPNDLTAPSVIVKPGSYAWPI